MFKKLMNVGVSNFTHPLLYGAMLLPAQVAYLHAQDADTLLQVKTRDASDQLIDRFVEVPVGTAHHFDLRDKFRAEDVSLSVRRVSPELLAAPSVEMLSDTVTVYQRNVAPHDRWISDGTKLVSAVLSPGGGLITIPGLARDFTPAHSVLSSSIPMVKPPNVTMAAGGAITMGVPLPTVYSRCYMYFAAGTLYSGSVAGFYYTEMSSASSGVVYNTRYVSGEPAIPSVLVPLPNPIVGAIATHVATTIALAGVLPGGLLGRKGRLEIAGRVTVMNNANAKAASVQVGSATLLNSNTPTSVAGVEFSLWMANRGRMDSQVLNTMGWMSSLPSTSSLPGYANADTSVDTPIQVNIAATTTGEYIVLESFRAVAIPAN